jgi:hypothetical protein
VAIRDPSIVATDTLSRAAALRLSEGHRPSLTRYELILFTPRLAPGAPNIVMDPFRANGDIGRPP